MNTSKLERYRSVLFFLFFFAFVLTEANRVYAQTDTSKHIPFVQIQEKRMPKISSSIPAQTIQSTEFLNKNAANVADAIKGFSGVNVRDYGGIGGLKTVSVRGLGAEHTGVFFDGVPVTDAQNGQIDLGEIFLNNISEITLINAQSPSLLLPAKSYSYASAIFIKSLVARVTAPNPFNLQVAVRGGSFGLIEPSIQWQQRINNHWTTGLNGRFTAANGKYSYTIEGNGTVNQFTRDNSDVTIYNADAFLQYKKDTTAQFNMRLLYNQSERGLPNAVVFYTDHGTQRLWDNDISIQASYQTEFNKKLSLLLTTRMGNKKVRYLDSEFLNIQGKLDQQYAQQEYYQSISAAYKVSKSIGISYAVDAAFNKLQTNLYQFVYPTRLSLWNVVATNFHRTGLDVRANLLYSHVNEWVKSGKPAAPYDILSPTIVIAFQPFNTQSLSIRSFFKDVFRAPTFNDLYYSRLGNVHVRPERAQQYNLGATYHQAYNGKFTFLQITADGYFNKVKDKIVAVPNKDIFSWSIVNIGKVDIRGLDLTLKTASRVAKETSLSFSANYTFQRVVDVTDPTSFLYKNQVPYVPKHSLGIHTSLEHRRWSASYNLLYASSRYYIGENTPEFRLPGYTVSDVSTSFKTTGKLPLTMAIEINNLFNNQYVIVRSFPMPGRSFRLSIHATL